MDGTVQGRSVLHTVTTSVGIFRARHICTQASTFIQTNACTRTHTHTHTSKHVQANRNRSAHAHTHAHMQTHTRAYIHKCNNAGSNTNNYTRTRTHIHTRTHTQVQTQLTGKHAYARTHCACDGLRQFFSVASDAPTLFFSFLRLYFGK